LCDDLSAGTIKLAKLGRVIDIAEHSVTEQLAHELAQSVDLGAQR
jgi:hypothetical protein